VSPIGDASWASGRLVGDALEAPGQLEDTVEVIIGQRFLPCNEVGLACR
jgi:hypothetical protein